MSQFDHSQSQQSRQLSEQAPGGAAAADPTAGVAGQTRAGATPAGGQAGGPAQLVGRQFPTRSYLPENVRTTSIAVCNQVLADAVVLHAQAKAAHWNVKGPNFAQLHDLFEEVADRLAGHVDEIAERATALGGEALGTVPMAAQHTTLQPLPRGIAEEDQMLRTIADRIAAFDATLYEEMKRVEGVDDLDTVDLLNEVSRDVSTLLWFVEAHLQGSSTGQVQSAGEGPVRG